MELEPVVEVVEVDRVGEHRAVIGDAAGAEDALAGGVVMHVALDGEVVLVDVGLGELFAVLADPRFERRISRALLGDELLDGIGAQAEGVAGHLVVALAQAGITGGELAGGFKGNLLPQAGEVKRAERAGDARTDERNVGGTHACMD